MIDLLVSVNSVMLLLLAGNLLLSLRRTEAPVKTGVRVALVGSLLLFGASLLIGASLQQSAHLAWATGCLALPWLLVVLLTVHFAAKARWN